MTSEQPAKRAAERLAALIDLAHEHDDDLSYIEVELLLAASRPRLALHETPSSPHPQSLQSRARLV